MPSGSVVMGQTGATGFASNVALFTIEVVSNFGYFYNFLIVVTFTLWFFSYSVWFWTFCRVGSGVGPDVL